MDLEQKSRRGRMMPVERYKDKETTDARRFDDDNKEGEKLFIFHSLLVHFLFFPGVTHR